MTKFNLSSKKHLIIIISVLIIAIGMAVGTICHFLAGGFFNYGSEFSSYKSVTVTYLAAEQTEDDVRAICSEAFAGLNPVEISYAEVATGGEAVYKFSVNADSSALESAVASINSKLAENSGLSCASLHTASSLVGGSKVLNMAAIALASAAAFQFMYFLFRFRWKAALAALLADVNNIGLFVALVAITRVPVGIEVVALASAVLLLTMIGSCAFAYRVRKNGKNEEYKKLAPLEIADISAGESSKPVVITACLFAVAIAVTAIFGVIAATSVTALAPYATAILAAVAYLAGSLFFTPSVYSALCGITVKTAKPAVVKTDK